MQLSYSGLLDGSYNMKNSVSFSHSFSLHLCVSSLFRHTASSARTIVIPMANKRKINEPSAHEFIRIDYVNTSNLYNNAKCFHFSQTKSRRYLILISQQKGAE